MKSATGSKWYFIPKSILCITFLIAFIAMISSASAQSPQITNGLNYLTSTQNPDGSWGDDTANTKIHSSTVEVIKTFQILNHEDNTYYSNAVLWLQSQTINTTNYLSQRIYALSVAGTDGDLLVSYLDELIFAWGGHDDYQANNFETATALQALNTINYQDPNPIEYALAYLLSNQNTDGGWGVYDGDESNVYMTSIVLKIIASYNGIYNFQTMVDNAVSYLIAHQNPDGGFGSSPSTVYETALAFESLVSSNADISSAAESALNYLNTTQLPDGSWDEDPYSTALALRVLGNKKPNLSISSSDITFSNTTPTVGQTIDITATVRNNGLEAAENVVVQFFDGDPDAGGIFIDEYMVSSITAYGNATVTLSWTIPTASSRAVFVKIDPSNEIDERDETDNVSFKNITPATLPDLSITSADISISPAVPLPGEQVTITAVVRNLGERSAIDVLVEFYDVDQSNNVIQIGNTTVASIAQGNSSTVQMPWSFSRGRHHLYVIVDRTDMINESDETNNDAQKMVVAFSPDDVDFSISAEDISFNPSSSMPGDTVSISATVHNQAPKTENATVTFYDGNPSYGGTKITEETITVPGNGMNSVTVSHTVSAKVTVIYVFVDEENNVFETDEANNTAHKKLTIGIPDLIVMDKWIKINRMSTGGIYISPLIRNLGGVDATDVTVSVYDGNPSSDGILIENTLIDLIPAGSGRRINIPYTLTPGRHDIYVVADPADQIVELSDMNNIGRKVVYATDPNGPDLTVTAVDASDITTDTQSLIISGTLNVTMENSSSIDVTETFHLTAYEDLNKNSFYDSGIDNKLGEITVNGLNASQTNNFPIDINGQISFRDNHIHVMADSTDVIIEKNEENKDRHHKEDCAFTPAPLEDFEVVEELTWRGSSIEPLKNKVHMSPVVANMNDDNGDGIIDEDDIPDIIFVSAASQSDAGVLRVIGGKDGEEIFSVTRPEPSVIHPRNEIAVGDIDNDGDPEILVSLRYWGDTGKFFVVAYNHDGTELWTSDTGIGSSKATPFIADLDNDGEPEIMMGYFLFNNQGHFLWKITGATTANIPIAVDLNNDDRMEVVMGRTTYKLDGTVYWFASLVNAIGPNAIGNFDADPSPEVIVTGSSRVYVVENDKTIKWWGQYNLFGSAPSIGDVDGDGSPEIAGQGNWDFYMINSDGTVRWDNPVYDSSGGQIAPVFFDLNGDGKAEIAVNDQRNFFIFNGDTGETLFETPNLAWTIYEGVSAADVDNDGHVELIYAGQRHSLSDPDVGGIRVFGEKNGYWVNSRRVWNQHSYHVTNMDEDNYIPLREENSWEKYNCYRCNVPIKNALDAPDLTASRIRLDQTQYPAYVEVSARIGNAGNLNVQNGVKVSFYDGDPGSGGLLIGTVATSNRLNPEEYEDLSLLWYTPPSEIREVFVIVDPDNEIRECDETNNSASVSFMIGGEMLPDLSVSPSDIIAPSSVIEGQQATLKAAVHNTGITGAENVMVSFYDGDPTQGGTLIHTVTEPHIDAGGAALVEVVWDTFGQSGINYIHIVLDPQNVIEELNENNNATLVQVDVVSPTMPDLTVASTDISFSNQTPKEGDPLTITVTVHNIGTDADTIRVDLYDGDPGSGGVLLNTYTILPIIPFGGQAQVVFNINTIGFSGNHNFHVVVDPENTIDEIREDNNSTSSDLLISIIGLDVTETTDKTQYNENEDILITVNVTDLQNETRELHVDVKVFDTNGYLADSLDAVSITVSPLSTETVNFVWNTDAILIGDYSVITTVYDTNMNPVARESVPVSIAASAGISSNLVLDKISYNANEQVRVTSTVTNQSTNIIYEDLTATVTIKNTTGQVLFTEDTSIGMLAPTAFQSFNTYWNTSTNPPGDYPVTLEVKDSSGTVLSTSTKVLAITDVINPLALLAGNVSVDTQSLLQGDPVNISYSITNIGNIDLSQVDLSILSVHVVELTAYDTLTDQTGLPMGGTYSNTQQLTTDTYSAKDYLVILRANISGTEETLAGTYFRVEGAPSPPSLSSPGQGDDVETYTPILEVNNSSDPNDDDITYEFELYSDSNLTDLVASSGIIEEGEGVTSWQVPSELVENETYYWRARAYDQLLYGEWMTIASFRVNVYNDTPTKPTLSSPADSSEVDTFTPTLVVNNSFDPDSTGLTYNFEVASDPDFLNIVTSVIGVFEGDGTTSWQVPDGVLSENTHYYWHAQADDWLDEGPWMETAVFFVNTANDAPSAPTVISPVDDSEITTLYMDITVSNSTDPDYDPLTYIFQVDTMNTFDSPNLTQSGNIPEGLDTTSWYVDGLFDNTYHYARALADDSLAQSPWSGTIRFFANTANDVPTTPVLANPSDGAGVSVFNPTLSVHNSEDIDMDILTYDFEVYDETMTSLITSVTGVEETPDITSWTVPMNLTENETYTWRARAYDGELYSGWMTFASFMINTANDAPSAPTLNAPGDGSSVETEYPTLSVNNADDPDSDTLTYDFEIYTGGVLVDSFTGIPEDASGVTSVTLVNALSDNTIYTWRARAYDGDRYGAWMDMATFTVHLPIVNITATIDFNPNTLNQKSNGKWVTVFIELPDGYDVNDIIISSILLENTVPAEPWPYCIKDHDKNGKFDLKVKFDRGAVIDVLPAGDNVVVHVSGTVGTVTFDGIDIIRVIH